MIFKPLLLAAVLAVLATANLAQARVYELRTYYCYEGKLDALKARFRDHTIRIFAKHGMESIGYWVPQDAPRSKNVLVYIISHPSREEAEKHWKDFQADPEWVKVRTESEMNGKIVEKVDREFLDPTDFSKLK
jgi:hypothetical protein